MFNFYAVLYAGAVLLLAAGLVGMLGLCSFSRALSIGGEGFFMSQVFDMFFVNNFVAFL